MKEVNLKPLEELSGFIGACVADAESGMLINSLGNFDFETAAAMNSEVVRAKLKAMKSLGLKDEIEDFLITLGKQYHLIRPLVADRTLFIYMVLDRANGNLGLARVGLRNLEARQA